VLRHRQPWPPMTFTIASAAPSSSARPLRSKLDRTVRSLDSVRRNQDAVGHAPSVVYPERRLSSEPILAHGADAPSPARDLSHSAQI
jgi:hypothetical protein